MTYDLVIHNGTIVTVNKHFEIISRGLLCVKDGKIERLDALAADMQLPAAKEILDDSVSRPRRRSAAGHLAERAHVSGRECASQP